jgi:hypothetical protein
MLTELELTLTPKRSVPFHTGHAFPFGSCILYDWTADADPTFTLGERIDEVRDACIFIISLDKKRLK